MIRHSLRGAVLMLLLVGPALAWPMAMNQRIDRALYHGLGIMQPRMTSSKSPGANGWRASSG